MAAAFPGPCPMDHPKPSRSDTILAGERRRCDNGSYTSDPKDWARSRPQVHRMEAVRQQRRCARESDRLMGAFGPLAGYVPFRHNWPACRHLVHVLLSSRTNR